MENNERIEKPSIGAAIKEKAEEIVHKVAEVSFLLWRFRMAFRATYLWIKKVQLFLLFFINSLKIRHQTAHITMINSTKFQVVHKVTDTEPREGQINKKEPPIGAKDQDAAEYYAERASEKFDSKNSSLSSQKRKSSKLAEDIETCLDLSFS
jgi:hypothetical protein